MSIKLVHLARALEVSRPDLTLSERADLAARITKSGGVTIDRDGHAQFSEEARQIEPKLPRSTKGMKAVSATPPRPATPRKTADELRSELSTLANRTDDRSKARRAYLRQEIAETDDPSLAYYNKDRP